MRNILITGTASKTGLGRAIVERFLLLESSDGDPITLHLLDKKPGEPGFPILTPRKWSRAQVIRYWHVDVTKSSDCVSLSQDLLASECRIDTLINCAGTHTLNYLENQTTTDFMRVIETNAAGILNMTRAFLPHLSHWPNGEEQFYGEITANPNPFKKDIVLNKREGGTVLNILSTAARVPMTASLAYQASKAAAWAMTEQLARELMPRHGISVFGISPNKLACTGMSLQVDERVKKVRGWDDAYMKKYSNTNICCGEETDVKTLSEFIVFLLSEKRRHKYLAGCILPYGHQR